MDTRITNENIYKLIKTLRDFDHFNYVKRITMRSDTTDLIMPLENTSKKVPYFELDFGLATDSAEKHPFMEKSFIPNAKSMGFVMKLSSAKGMKDRSDDNKTKSFVVKPKYTFRRYSDIQYGGWLRFMDVYLKLIIEQQDRDVNENI